MAEIWTISRILNWTKQYFAAKGVESPRLDAEVLLSHLLGKDRIYLYVHFDQPLTGEELAQFRDMVRQRAKRVPVAYILGEKEFMGFSFTVSPAVLIPRPDTEILVEAVQKRLEGQGAPRIADLGTGSGAIIVSLLALLPEASGVGVDISPAALEVAEQNARRHQVDARLSLVEGDLYKPLTGEFSVIVSNPPYIPAADIMALAPEVRGEPLTALDGGADGLDFYREILAGAAPYLADDGFLAVEVGQGQAVQLRTLAESSPFYVETIIPDYNGIERVVILKKKR